jgi:hypothetical protein
MTVANTLAYFDIARIMTIKTIIVHARMESLMGTHSKGSLQAFL